MLEERTANVIDAARSAWITWRQGGDLSFDMGRLEQALDAFFASQPEPDQPAGDQDGATTLTETGFSRMARIEHMIQRHHAIARQMIKERMDDFAAQQERILGILDRVQRDREYS